MESNDPPEAEVTIASSQPYPAGTAILLDGTSSSDPDGDSLSYSWSLSTPSGSNASLADDDASQTTFTPDTDGDYTATLQVSDGEEYVRIRHGASQEMSSVGARGNVVLNNDAELTLKDSEIEDSDQHGVHCDDASTTLTYSGNSFSNISGSNYNAC